MKDISENVILSSTLKALTNASVYGRLETSKISLFNVITYFIRESEKVKVIKGDKYKETLDKLNTLSQSMLWEFSNELCNYKDLIGSDINIPENNPPIVDNHTIGNFELDHTFKVGDFLNNYRDRQNDSWNKLTIKYNSWNGTLRYNGAHVNNDIVIDIRNMNKVSDLDLVYSRSNAHLHDITEDIIYFTVSDDNVNSLHSNIRELKVINQPLTNQPPIIGDIGLVVDNNTTTVLSYDIFINQMDPTYLDPEGDDIDSIRIESISGNNKGLFKFKGINIQVGDIISADDLRNGDLIHVGPSDDSINTDYFSFAVRDVGSLIWVT